MNTFNGLTRESHNHTQRGKKNTTVGAFMERKRLMHALQLLWEFENLRSVSFSTEMQGRSQLLFSNNQSVPGRYRSTGDFRSVWLDTDGEVLLSFYLW